jgi:ERCC4-type nuclease
MGSKTESKPLVTDYFIGCTSFLNKNTLYQKGVKETILDNMVIEIDTREKKIDHIINYFDKGNNKVQYEIKKLDIGDYSYHINPNKYVPYGFYANNVFTIDRKQNTDELVSNMISDRDRFEKELLKAHDKRMYFVLLIEDIEYLNNLHKGKYKSQANKESVLGSYNSFMISYDIKTLACSQEFTAKQIVNLCRQHMSNELTQGTYATKWRGIK